VESLEFPEWAEQVVQYLKEGKLPADKKKSRQVQMCSSRYTMIGVTLYKRGYMLPLLKCIFKAEADYVLREIHEGVCGSNMGSRMLAHRAIKFVYLWPHMNEDSTKIVQSCDKCQRFAGVMLNPSEELSSVSTP
jgi:ribosomal protein S14